VPFLYQGNSFRSDQPKLFGDLVVDPPPPSPHSSTPMNYNPFFVLLTCFTLLLLIIKVKFVRQIFIKRVVIVVLWLYKTRKRLQTRGVRVTPPNYTVPTPLFEESRDENVSFLSDAVDDGGDGGIGAGSGGSGAGANEIAGAEGPNVNDVDDDFDFGDFEEFKKICITRKDKHE
jgi:hypothetical protein